MIEYYVRSDGETHVIIADEVSWGGNGLKFNREKQTIALFLNWSWFYQADADEWPEIEEQ